MDQKFHKKIIYKFKGIDVNFLTIHVYSLFYSTIDNITILTWDAEIVSEHYKKTQIEFLKLERKQILQKYDDYFKKKVDQFSYNVESIIIKNNFFSIWKIITDWNLFQKYVPIIAESVAYEGEKLNGGSKIYLHWKSKNVSCTLKIIGYVVNNLDHVFELELFEGEPKLPLQKLTLCLKKLDENFCFLFFRHLFLEPIEFHDIENLSKTKRNILVILKNALEKSV